MVLGAASLALVAFQAVYLYPAGRHTYYLPTVNDGMAGGASFPPSQMVPGLLANLIATLHLLLASLAVLELLVLLAPPCWRPRTWVVGLCQALLALGLVADAELATRVAVWPYRYIDWMAPDATRYWTFNHGTSDPKYTVNSHGLRGLEINPSRQPGEFRILCLGDSISAGDKLAETETYPFVLQGYLRKLCPGTLIRVQNGAVNGYSILQGAMTLEAVAGDYQPDLVILEFTHANLTTVDRYERAFLSHRWPLVNLRRLAFDSMVYLTMRQVLQPYRERESDPEASPRTVVSTEARERECRLFRKYLEWIVGQSRTRGFRTVVYMPYSDSEARLRSRPRAASAPRDKNYWLRRIARENDIPLVDLGHSWAKIPKVRKFLQDDCHPNVAGTVMQATDIGRFLLEKGLVPGYRPSAQAGQEPGLRARAGRASRDS